MILNNPTTQEVIVINRITNGIIYTKYENAYYRDNDLNGFVNAVAWELDKTLMPDPALSFGDNELKLAYEYLITLPAFSGYQITSDPQAWTMNTKSLRIFVNNSEIMNAMEVKDVFNDIIVRLRDENSITDPKFIYRGSTQTIVYLNSVLAEDQAVVLEKQGTSLFIEYKNI